MFSRALLKALFGVAGVGINGEDDKSIVVGDSSFIVKALSGRGGTLAFGEAYMRGEYTAERLELVLAALAGSWLAKLPSVEEIKYWLRGRVSDPQSEERSYDVAREHYDLPVAFYRIMLGRPMVYTSALGMVNGLSHDAAQNAKLERLVHEVDATLGERVLDVGFGYGTLMHAFARRGINTVGVSLSEGQRAYALERYAGTNVPMNFRLCDYRNFNETVDHIVSVEMIEAVGRRHMREFYAKLRSLLPNDGREHRFGLQAIVANDEWGTGRDAFLGKYIFPGGELPRMSDLKAAAEGLFELRSEKFFGLDYACTLAAWRNNIVAARDEVVDLIGETKFRMMEFYLALCEAGFATGQTTVGQFTYVAK